MEIRLQLFGAFRPLGEELKLTLDKGAIVSDIRAALIEVLGKVDNKLLKQGVVESSRFATETEILSESALLKDGEVIAIIPPVAGG